MNELGQRLRFVAVGSPAVDVDDIGLDPLGNFSLIFEFSNRGLHDFGLLRVQHNELIGMEAGSQLLLLHERAALLEATNDLVAIRQIAY